MNADMFRTLYAYHFALNRRIWDECIVPLTSDQFTRKVEYSVGSARNQVVHMLNIDDRWFSGLRGETVPDFLNLEIFSDHAVIRAKWDDIETRMRDYLSRLKDSDLSGQPFIADNDQTQLWHILQHVVIHGADHRAQLLVILDQLGIKTFPQDFILYTWEQQM